MDNVPFVQVIDGVENLPNGLGCILLGKLAVLADPIEQFAASRKLRDNVEFVLSPVRSSTSIAIQRPLTLDSNQSTKWTIWGWLRDCSISSSS
jgi:hypothetical protein